MAKTTTKLTGPENATQTLHDLTAKRDAIAKASAADQSEMDAVAFEAHTGNQRAEAKLETLKKRALRRDLELRSIDSAITVAKEKVALAQAESAKVAERVVADELRELAKFMKAAAKKCDAALAMLGEGAEELRKSLIAVNSRGLTHPTGTQLQSFGERAVLTALLTHPWARAFTQAVGSVV